MTTILDTEEEIIRMERALREPGRETEAGPSPDPQSEDEPSVARLTERPTLTSSGAGVAERLNAPGEMATPGGCATADPLGSNPSSAPDPLPTAQLVQARALLAWSRAL